MGRGPHGPEFYARLVNALIEERLFAELPALVEKKLEWLALKELAVRCEAFLHFGIADAHQAWQMLSERLSDEKLQHSSQLGKRVGWEAVEKPE